LLQALTRRGAPPAIASDPAVTTLMADKASTSGRDAMPVGMRVMLDALVPVWVRQLETVQHIAQDGMAALLDSVSSMVAVEGQLQRSLQQHADISEMHQCAQSLSTHCEAVMLGLQFGDRIHQMLDVLRNDLDRFIGQIDELAAAGPEDAQRWLSELEAQYTTDEQRQSHQGDEGATPTSTIDFF